MGASNFFAKRKGSIIEPISKIGFWFEIAAGLSFKPEAYGCMLRI
jgi:hypothetical protein